MATFIDPDVGQSFDAKYAPARLGQTGEESGTENRFIFLEVESVATARGWCGVYDPETFKANLKGGTAAAALRKAKTYKPVVACTGVSIGKRGWFQVWGVHASIRKATGACNAGNRWALNSVSTTVKRRARALPSGKITITARIGGIFLAAGTAATAAVKGFVGYGY